MSTSNFDIIKANLFLGASVVTQGKVLHVKPYSGSNGNTGKSPSKAFKTLAKAQSIATADKNDVVYLYGESNTASLTTDYQTVTLDWAKDGVHLIGVNSGPMLGHRARIAFISTYDTASHLMTVSADGCRFENIEFYAGVAGTNPTGCVQVTGDRNVFVNCQISGIGHANNDIANAFSLHVQGSENVFRHCVIGLDTIARGTGDNCEILLKTTGTSGCARNVFEDCIIQTNAEANTHQFVKRPSGGSDRWNLFKNCTFINNVAPGAGGTTMLEAIDATASGTPSGIIVLDQCSLYGCASWDAATASGIVYANMSVPDDFGGVGVAYVGS